MSLSLKKLLYPALAVLGMVFGSAMACRGASDFPTVYRVTYATGTTANLVTTGSGVLYSVIIASGSAGAYSACYDAASAAGITVGQETSLIDFAQVAASSTSYKSVAGNTSPIPFTNGLVCGNSAAMNSWVRYKKSGY